MIEFSFLGLNYTFKLITPIQSTRIQQPDSCISKTGMARVTDCNMKQ